MSLRGTVLSVLLGVVALGALAPVTAAATTNLAAVGTSYGGGGGKAGAGRPADRKLIFKLRAAKRQPLLAQGGLRVKLRCPKEVCAVAVQAASSTLKPVRVELAAGATETVELKIRKGKRRAIQDILRSGKLKLRVSATAIDAAGNTAVAELFVTAKR